MFPNQVQWLEPLGECSFQTVSGEKPTNTTIVSYISAGGMTMPPLVIFKAARIKPEWHKAAPTGYMIRGSASRYINAKLFQEYGKQFVHFVTEKKILTRDRKVLLLLDMHKSYLFNFGFMEFMKGHNVEVCCFPPHCTHVLQPLDDIPFALFKAEYESQLLWINQLLSGHRMSRMQFFRVLVPAYATGMTTEAIRSAFRNTGIYPINREAEKLKQIRASDVYDKCRSILD